MAESVHLPLREPLDKGGKRTTTPRPSQRGAIGHFTGGRAAKQTLAIPGLPTGRTDTTLVPSNALAGGGRSETSREKAKPNLDREVEINKFSGRFGRPHLGAVGEKGRTKSKQGGKLDR